MSRSKAPEFVHIPKPADCDHGKVERVPVGHSVLTVCADCGKTETVEDNTPPPGKIRPPGRVGEHDNSQEFLTRSLARHLLAMRVHEFYNYLDSRKKKGGQDALATVYRIVAAELLTRGKAENQSWLFKLDNTRREIIKKNMREIHAARMQKRNDKITSLAS